MTSPVRLTVQCSSVVLTVKKRAPIPLTIETGLVPILLCDEAGDLIVTEDGYAIQVGSYYDPITLTIKKNKSVSITIRS